MLYNDIRLLIAGVDFPYMSIFLNSYNAKIYIELKEKPQDLSELIKYEPIPIMVLSKNSDSIYSEIYNNNIENIEDYIIIFEGITKNINYSRNPNSNRITVEIIAEKLSPSVLNSIIYSEIRVAEAFKNIAAAQASQLSLLTSKESGNKKIVAVPEMPLTRFVNDIFLFKILNNGNNVTIKRPHDVLEFSLSNLRLPLYATNKFIKDVKNDTMDVVYQSRGSDLFNYTEENVSIINTNLYAVLHNLIIKNNINYNSFCEDFVEILKTIYNIIYYKNNLMDVIDSDKIEELEYFIKGIEFNYVYIDKFINNNIYFELKNLTGIYGNIFLHLSIIYLSLLSIIAKSGYKKTLLDWLLDEEDISFLPEKYKIIFLENIFNTLYKIYEEIIKQFLGKATYINNKLSIINTVFLKATRNENDLEIALKIYSKYFQNAFINKKDNNYVLELSKNFENINKNIKIKEENKLQDLLVFKFSQDVVNSEIDSLLYSYIKIDNIINYSCSDIFEKIDQTPFKEIFVKEINKDFLSLYSFRVFSNIFNNCLLIIKTSINEFLNILKAASYETHSEFFIPSKKKFENFQKIKVKNKDLSDLTELRNTFVDFIDKFYNLSKKEVQTEDFSLFDYITAKKIDNYKIYKRWGTLPNLADYSITKNYIFPTIKLNNINQFMELMNSSISEINMPEVSLYYSLIKIYKNLFYSLSSPLNFPIYKMPVNGDKIITETVKPELFICPFLSNFIPPKCNVIVVNHYSKYKQFDQATNLSKLIIKYDFGTNAFLQVDAPLSEYYIVDILYPERLLKVSEYNETISKEVDNSYILPRSYAKFFFKLEEQDYFNVTPLIDLLKNINKNPELTQQVYKLDDYKLENIELETLINFSVRNLIAKDGPIDDLYHFNLNLLLQPPIEGFPSKEIINNGDVFYEPKEIYTSIEDIYNKYSINKSFNIDNNIKFKVGDIIIGYNINLPQEEKQLEKESVNVIHIVKKEGEQEEFAPYEISYGVIKSGETIPQNQDPLQNGEWMLNRIDSSKFNLNLGIVGYPVSVKEDFSSLSFFSTFQKVFGKLAQYISEILENIVGYIIISYILENEKDAFNRYLFLSIFKNIINNPPSNSENIRKYLLPTLTKDLKLVFSYKNIEKFVKVIKNVTSENSSYKEKITICKYPEYAKEYFQDFLKLLENMKNIPEYDFNIDNIKNIFDYFISLHIPENLIDETSDIESIVLNKRLDKNEKTEIYIRKKLSKCISYPDYTGLVFKLENNKIIPYILYKKPGEKEISYKNINYFYYKDVSELYDKNIFDLIYKEYEEKILEIENILEGNFYLPTTKEKEIVINYLYSAFIKEIYLDLFVNIESNFYNNVFYKLLSIENKKEYILLSSPTKNKIKKDAFVPTITESGYYIKLAPPIPIDSGISFYTSSDIFVPRKLEFENKKVLQLHDGIDYSVYDKNSYNLGTEENDSKKYVPIVAACNGSITYDFNFNGYGLYCLLVPNLSPSFINIQTIKDSNVTIPVFIYAHLNLYPTIKMLFNKVNTSSLTETQKKAIENLSKKEKEIKELSIKLQTNKQNSRFEKDSVLENDPTYKELTTFLNTLQTLTITVTQNDTIGYLGHTGLSSGPHLHFGAFKYDMPLSVIKAGSYSGLKIKDIYYSIINKFDNIRKTEISNQSFDSIISSYNNGLFKSGDYGVLRREYKKYLYDPRVLGLIGIEMSTLLQPPQEYKSIVASNGYYSVLDVDLSDIISSMSMTSNAFDNNAFYSTLQTAKFFLHSNLIERLFSIRYIPNITLPYIDPYFVDGDMPTVIVYKNDIIFTTISDIYIQISTRNTVAYQLVFGKGGYSLRTMLYFYFGFIERFLNERENIVFDDEETFSIDFSKLPIYPFSIIPEYNKTLLDLDSMNDAYKKMFGKDNFAFDWRDYVFYKNEKGVLISFKEIFSNKKKLFDFVKTFPKEKLLLIDSDSSIIIDQNKFKDTKNNLYEEELSFSNRRWGKENLYTFNIWKKVFMYNNVSIGSYPQYFKLPVKKKYTKDNYQLSLLSGLKDKINILSETSLLYQDWGEIMKLWREYSYY